MLDDHPATHLRPISTLGTTGFVLALGVMWGAGIFLAAIALNHGIPPLLFALFEAGAICAVSNALHARYGSGRMFAAGTRQRSAVTGLTLVVIPYLATYAALGHIGPALAATTQTLTALLTAVIAVGVGTASLSRRQWCGVLVGLVGVVVLALLAHRGPGGAGGAPWWVAIACLAPLSYAVSNVYVSEKRSVPQSAVTAAAGANSVAAVILALVYLGSLAVSHSETPHPSVVGCVCAAAAISCNLAASLTYFRIASRGRAVDVGVAGYVMTVVGVVLSWTFLHAAISARELGAIVVTVAGVALTRLQR